MIREWQNILLERTGEWGLPGTGDWHFLFHNNYHSHHSNINVLWFHGRDRYPRTVAKIYRSPDIPNREFENLQRAYSAVPEWVPKPLHFDRHGEFWILWMEGVPGTRLFHYSPSQLRSIGDTVTSVQLSLRRAAAKPAEDRWRKMVSEPLGTLSQFGSAAAVAEGCAEVANRATAAWLNSLPSIPQHGDLFIDNILLDRDNWHIIDWESLGTVDLPAYDLFTLLFSLLNVGRETPGSWDPALVKQMPPLVQECSTRLGLNKGDLGLLLPLTLANWFHLQWSDGREAFAVRMYQMARHYFEERSLWERVFNA